MTKRFIHADSPIHTEKDLRKRFVHFKILSRQNLKSLNALFE